MRKHEVIVCKRNTNIVPGSTDMIVPSILIAFSESINAHF
jgi:hypothetical protein